MNESVQPLDRGNKTEKRAYGTTCRSCKRTFQLGYVWLQPSAQLADLHSEVAAKGGLKESDDCPRQDCKASNLLSLNRLIFVGADGSALESQVDHLWKV
jgi:hypothetical protein